MDAMKTTPSTVPPSAFSRTLRKLLPPLLIMPTVALILSAFMAWANVGSGPAFAGAWARGFVSSLVILPLVLAALGPLERLVLRLFPGLHSFGRKIVVSLLTAFAIESVLSLAVTAINSPWNGGFAGSWWLAFSRSLPVGVLIGLCMAFVVKPRLARWMETARA